MKYYQLFIFIILMVCLNNLSCSKAGDSNNAELSQKIKNAKMIVYPSVTDIKTVFNKKYNIKSVSYELKESYPAKDVVGYYQKEMRRLNYQLADDIESKGFNMKWKTYEDGTINGVPFVASLTINWINDEKDLQALLILRYYYVNKSRIILENNKELKVIFQISGVL